MFKLKSKLIVAVMVIFGITAFMSSCDKNTKEETTNKNLIYEQKISKFKISYSKSDKVATIEISNEKNNSYGIYYVSDNIEINPEINAINNTKLFFISLDNDTPSVYIFDNDKAQNNGIVYHCDCDLSPQEGETPPICQTETNNNIIRCIGSNCCEGYIEVIEPKKDNNSQNYFNGLLIACDKLVFNNKIYE